jgi:hypothetical protein
MVSLGGGRRVRRGITGSLRRRAASGAGRGCYGRLLLIVLLTMGRLRCHGCHSLESRRACLRAGHAGRLCYGPRAALSMFVGRPGMAVLSCRINDGGEERCSS